MGIRVHYVADGTKYVVKLRECFYWEHMAEIDSSLESRDPSIWYQYNQEEECLNTTEMLLRWSSISEIAVY